MYLIQKKSVTKDGCKEIQRRITLKAQRGARTHKNVLTATKKMLRGIRGKET